MCVSAVTEEMIAEGNVVVTKEDSSIRVKIEDKDGRLMQDTRYAYMNEWSADDDDEILTVHWGRLYNGQFMKINVTFTMDHHALSGPVVEAKGLGQMTATEALILLNATMYDEYVVTDVKQDKWGYISKVNFDLKWRVDDIKREAKREAKKKEMAEALIS